MGQPAAPAKQATKLAVPRAAVSSRRDHSAATDSGRPVTNGGGGHGHSHGGGHAHSSDNHGHDSSHGDEGACDGHGHSHGSHEHQAGSEAGVQSSDAARDGDTSTSESRDTKAEASARSAQPHAIRSV